MKENPRILPKRIHNNWLLLVYIVVTIGVYFIYTAKRGNYWSGLIIPMIASFIWIGVAMQKFRVAMGLAAIFAFFMFFLTQIDYISSYILQNFVITIIIISVGYGMYRLSWIKSITIIVLLYLGILFSYILGLMEGYVHFNLLIIGGLALLSKYLLETRKST